MPDEKKPESFWRGVFSEADGIGSWARVASTALVVAAIAWISFIVWKTRVIPSVGEVTALMTAPYAVNKLSTMFGKTGNG